MWKFFTNTGTEKIDAEPATTPVGLITPFAGAAAPTDEWLLCQGQEVARATYPLLDREIGTTYGAYTNGSNVAGTTHLRLPDLRGRVPAGRQKATAIGSSGTGAVTSTVAFTNPSFDTNTTGWTAATSTATRDTLVYDSGSASLRWDNTGASDIVGFGDTLTGTLTGTFYAGQTYKLTWRVRASSNYWHYVYFGSGADTAFHQVANQGVGAFSTVEIGVTNYEITWTPATTVSGATLTFNDRSSFFGYGAYFWFDSFAINEVAERSLGTWEGTERVQLTGSMSALPNHTHPVGAGSHTHTATITAHTHSTNYNAVTLDPDTGANNAFDLNGGYPSVYQTGAASVANGSPTSTLSGITVNNAADASGTEHNNLQPFVGVNYLIRVK
jgi:microcystin-dependent protein